jgi:predicted ATPase
MAIKEIHDTVFNHLREKYPDLRFTLRKIDKGGRLRKGYWFIGNDDYLAFSFWQGDDWQHKTPNIIFLIYANHKTVFELMDYENGQKRHFFEQISKPLKMTPIKPKMEGAITLKWQRMYSVTDYIKALDNFINNEKVLIDTFISFNGNLLPPIDELSFKNSLKKIEQYRQSVPMINPIKTTQPIRIQRLSLTNITHFNHLEITLHPRVTCFLGENGSGKTTILRAIVFGLVGFSNTAFVREDVEKLKYELNNFLKIEKAQNDQYDYATNGEIALFYNQNKKNIIKFHPKWQSHILNVLVTNFPNVQFIVTTHSPYVVGSIPKGLMKLYICKQQVEEFTEFTPYGANVQRLTEKIFGTPVRFGVIATMVTQLRTAIQNNDFEKADQLLQSLEELGVGDDDNDPEIGSLKIILRTKKRKAGI